MSKQSAYFEPIDEMYTYLTDLFHSELIVNMTSVELSELMKTKLDQMKADFISDKINRNGSKNGVVRHDFQKRATTWAIDCFGQDAVDDLTERRHRFLEEVFELDQSAGGSVSEIIQLALYVYNREVGEPNQELGGVLNTLALLATRLKLNMINAAELELQRVLPLTEKIRGKQKTKPQFVPYNHLNHIYDPVEQDLRLIPTQIISISNPSAVNHDFAEFMSHQKETICDALHVPMKYPDKPNIPTKVSGEDLSYSPFFPFRDIPRQDILYDSYNKANSDYEFPSEDDAERYIRKSLLKKIAGSIAYSVSFGLVVTAAAFGCIYLGNFIHSLLH